jgi:hypothetical protein
MLKLVFAFYLPLFLLIIETSENTLKKDKSEKLISESAKLHIFET